MDGVGFEPCKSECGFLEGAVEAGHAEGWKMRACLPTISVPIYETIHTGLSPQEHGILGNDSIRQSTSPNIFNLLKSANKTTAVVAHTHFHNIYGGSKYDPFEHCEIEDTSAPIPYARYYTMEGSTRANSCLPGEIDLCAQAWTLAQRHEPDYLLVHSSSADTLGHFFTSQSAEYRIQVWQIDNALSKLIPRLIEQGYEVIVTADHGINTDGHHGGNQPHLREIPFYYFGEKSGPAEGDILDQRAIAPTILSLVGVSAPATMKFTSLL